MDAYCSYITRLSEARVGELRREAAERALSRAANGSRSLWERAFRRLAQRRRPAVVAPVTPADLPATAAEVDLRRRA